jgi:hypothetical protein
MFRGLPLWLRRLRHRLGLNQRGRRQRRTAVEIGDCTGCLGSRRRSEFVGDRSGETVFRAVATPAATAATSATSWTTFAVWSLIGTRNARLFVAFLVVGFALVGNRAFDHFRRHAHGVIVVTRRAALTRFTPAAPAAAALAAVAVRFALTGDRFLGAGDFVA